MRGKLVGGHRDGEYMDSVSPLPGIVIVFPESKAYTYDIDNNPTGSFVAMEEERYAVSHIAVEDGEELVFLNLYQGEV